MKDGAVKDGTIEAGTVKDGTIKAGTVKDDTVKAGTMNAGTVKDGTVKAGAVKDGGGGSRSECLGEPNMNVGGGLEADACLKIERKFQKCIDTFHHLLAKALNKRQLQIN